MAKRSEVVAVAGREVTVTNPDKVFFAAADGAPAIAKLDLVHYYLAVADGALRGAGGRPMAMKRFPDGAAGSFFFQKRAPANLPEWIRTAQLAFPSGRTADEVVIDDPAGLAWVINLGCIDLNPHPVRADDLDHPDELRVDLDPVPGVPWDQVRAVALAVRASLGDAGLVGWPKTSGSRGIHVNVRIERQWTFPEVRRAALALARDVERRVPDLATSKWWKEERHGVFIDYNQNAKDRTVASAYSVRPRPDARVSAPLRWDEVATVDAAAFTVHSMPARFARRRRPGGGHRGERRPPGRTAGAGRPGRGPGPRRRAVAAAVSEGRGRAAARAAVQAADVEQAPHRDRTGGRPGGRDRRPGAVEGASRGGGRQPAAGRRPRRLDARALHDLDPHPGQPRARPARSSPGPGAARPRTTTRGRGSSRPGRPRP